MKKPTTTPAEPKPESQVLFRYSSQERIRAIATLAEMGKTLAEALNRPDVVCELNGNISCHDLTIGGPSADYLPGTGEVSLDRDK